MGEVEEAGDNLSHCSSGLPKSISVSFPKVQGNSTNLFSIVEVNHTRSCCNLC